MRQFQNEVQKWTKDLIQVPEFSTLAEEIAGETRMISSLYDDVQEAKNRASNLIGSDLTAIEALIFSLERSVKDLMEDQQAVVKDIDALICRQNFLIAV